MCGYFGRRTRCIYIDIYTLQLCIIDLTQRVWHALRHDELIVAFRNLENGPKNESMNINSKNWTFNFPDGDPNNPKVNFRCRLEISCLIVTLM